MNKALEDKIIDNIRKNRISTTEVADALNKTGFLPDILPLNRKHHRVGKIFLVWGYNGSNNELHEQLESAPKDSIVLVKGYMNDEKAFFGELVSKYLILYREVAGIVADGYLRDTARLIKENYPIWLKGVTPIGTRHFRNEKPIRDDLLSLWKSLYEDGIAVCDDGGVIIIKKENITEEFLQKLEFVELQEDIWHYCLDTLKWSTYKIVCMKEYLKNMDVLPPDFREKFKALTKE